jgi:uncharacterized protein (TIGR03435 family)
VTALIVVAFACAGAVLAQGVTPTAEPVFDVVSIKRNTEKGPFGRPVNPSLRMRPDGGMTLISVPVGMIIMRAYELPSPRYIVGLPAWVTSEPYDVIATSSLDTATPAQHRAMLRAMLADRFRLAGHSERRTFDAYDLVLARPDGRLGPGLTKIDKDCAPMEAERTVALAKAQESGEPPSLPRPPGPGEPPVPCNVRVTGVNPRAVDYRGDLMEGEGTIRAIASMLRLSAGGPVTDKTGLAGTYRVFMMYGIFALQRGPDVNPGGVEPPSVLVALPEQLGLRLQKTRDEHEVLVVDRIERPSEN